MTSLASLTHPAAAAPPFNGLFYATAATIIPVLFLAVTIQGRAYQNLVNAANAALERQTQPPTGLRRTIAAATASIALSGIAAAIVTFSVASEIVAVVALYQQHDSFLRLLVLAGTILMIIVAAGPPALAFFRQDRSLPRDAPAPDVTRAASPETGKTDPA